MKMAACLCCVILRCKIMLPGHQFHFSAPTTSRHWRQVSLVPSAKVVLLACDPIRWLHSAYGDTLNWPPDWILYRHDTCSRTPGLGAYTGVQEHCWHVVQACRWQRRSTPTAVARICFIRLCGSFKADCLVVSHLQTAQFGVTCRSSHA